MQQELVYEDVELHTHRPGRFFAVALQHAETACVQDSQAVLEVRELCLVYRRQIQTVVLEVRHAEKDEARERFRLQVSEDDLANVPADVDEMLCAEDMRVDEHKMVPVQCLHDSRIRTRQEVCHEILVE
jgi:hypothetical protein